MKRTILAILAVATLLPAQVTHQLKHPCPNLEEEIPKGVVEPQYKDSQPFCPRDDFKLEWYVVGSSPSWTSSGYITYDNRGGFATLVDSGNTHYVFVAKCVKKEAQ